MATTVTIPTTADLPTDWKTTLMGVIAAVIVLVKMYLSAGVITWEGAAIAVGVAIVGYFLPAKVKVSPDEELVLTQRIAAVVQDLVAKQPVLPDAETLVAETVRAVTAALAPADPIAAEPSPVVAAGIVVGQ